MKDDLWWLLLPLTVKTQLSPNRNYYQLSQPEIEFAIVENVCGIVHAHLCRKEDIFMQKRLNHYNIGVGREKDNWTHYAALISKKE